MPLISTNSQPLLPTNKTGERGKRCRASLSLLPKRRHLLNTWSLFVGAFLMCCLLLFYYLTGTSSNLPYAHQQKGEDASFSSATTTNDDKATNGTSSGNNKFIVECKLPRVDPWDPALQPYLDPTYMNWQKNCKRGYPALTQLFKGRMLMHPEAKDNGTHCQFKCLYPQTDYELMEGAWKEIDEEQPDCDIVETRCQHEKIQNNAFYYSYLHVQIYRRDAKAEAANELPLPPTPRSDIIDIERTPDFGPDNGQGQPRPAPDVHVIVIDSLSHTQFLRTMPKTVTWLRERMDAIPFSHLNKIGVNSRPNGYGMLLGIQDQEPFVGFEYRARGYRTMMAEDWNTGVFNWPNIKGFERLPTDHYMRPFYLRVEAPLDQNEKLKKIVYKKSCVEPQHYLMRYLMHFIDTYQDQPKFSLSWIIHLAHNNVNGPYHFDEDFYHFLKDYEQKLNNSFLFLMGDHGLRFSDIRTTKQGEVEDNNPTLFLVLPQHLRYNNRLANNLRENARQLLTHLDIHATLVNIAREGANMTVHTPFERLVPELKGPTPLGQSLLYAFDKKMARNCDSLKIPFELCQCQFDTRDVAETEPALATLLGEAVVGRINTLVASKKAGEKCAHLALCTSKPVEIVEFEPERKTDVFKVTFETLPGNGRFWAYMRVEHRGLASQNFTFISTRFPRTNEYVSQAFCLGTSEDDYAIGPYCFCKTLLSTATTKTMVD